MPDFITLAIVFVVAIIAALVVAWLVGHSDMLADFVNLDRNGFF